REAAMSDTSVPVAPGSALLAETRRSFWRALLFAFALTAVGHLLALVVPLYSMQLYNLVLNTRNTNSLTWLSVGLALATALFGALEYLRAIFYDAMAARAARRLTLPALLAALRAPESAQGGASAQAIRDLGEIRSFLGGSAISAPLDLAWSPLLLAVLFVMHWAYGIFAVLCALLLFGL